MMPHGSERRVRRSADPAEALSWWLEASRLRNKLKNLALADDLGTLVSGAGSARECDELAAWAPLVAERKHAGGPDALPPVTGVKLPGFDAYVCTEGEPERHGEVLGQVAAGCARILSRSSTPLSAHA